MRLPLYIRKIVLAAKIYLKTNCTVGFLYVNKTT